MNEIVDQRPLFVRRIRGGRYFGLGSYNAGGGCARHYIGLGLVEIPVGPRIVCSR